MKNLLLAAMLFCTNIAIAQGRIYVLVDADTQNRKDLFDHKLVAAALSEASGRKIEATSLYLDRLSVNNGLDTLRFVFNNHRWMYVIDKIS